MRNLLLFTVFAVTVSFAFNQISFAVCGGGPTVFVCDTADPNPDPVGIQELGNNQNLNISVLPGAGIDTTILAMDDDGIETGNGMNEISVDGGSIIGEDNGIKAGQDIDRVTINNAVIHSLTNDTIDLNDGNDVLEIVDSIITAVTSNLVRLDDDDDIAHVTGSELRVLTADGNDTGFNAGSGNDNVFIEDTIIQGGTTLDPLPKAIDLASGNDVLTLGNGVVLKGLVSGNVESFGIIDCGSGFDTIIFDMDVPEEAVNAISSQILSSNPADGSITINGLFYIWEDCELLVPQLNGVREVKPIPTLSQWGLIAMAGVLGMIGLLAIRRRKVAA